MPEIIIKNRLFKIYLHFIQKIGLPNVGKSSLLNSLTRARAKIGDYSFTTLHPHVGVVEYEDFKQITIADLPGLLPDLTRGFGTKFLHHLERCKILILIIDLSTRSDSPPLDQYTDMVRALDSFDPNILASKPLVIIGNKIDEPNAAQRLEEFKTQINRPVVPMSATKKINLKKFLTILRHLYEEI